MRSQHLVELSNEYDKVIDFFLRDEFGDLVSDEQFFELYLRYFRTDIMGNSLLSRRFFLRPSEKTLQYVRPQAIESAVEYLFLVRDSTSAAAKARYAKKGGDFCVVIPVLHERREPAFHERLAARFYQQAAVYAGGELNRKLFEFLGGVTHEMTDGLANILANIRRDGLATLRTLYGELIVEYDAVTDGEESREIARALIHFGRLLELPDDEIPLRGEHYGLLFTE